MGSEHFIVIVAGEAADTAENAADDDKDDHECMHPLTSPPINDNAIVALFIV